MTRARGLARYIMTIGLSLMPVGAALAADPTWVQASTDGGFLKRDSARIFAFNNRIWMSQGYEYGNILRNDLLVTGAGPTWTMLNPDVPYEPYAPVAVHRGKIVIVGDTAIRTTTDGKNFATLVDPTPFRVGELFIGSHLIGDFNGTLVLIMPDNVMISADDGRTWTAHPTPWPAGYVNFAATVYNGQIYVLGGSLKVPNVPPEAGYADITSYSGGWRTSDPAAGWERIEAPWAARMWPAVAVNEGKLWLAGGFSNVRRGNLDDTWSFDGRTWEKVWTKASFTGRHAASMFALNGYLYICGGNRNPDISPGTQNDCWALHR